MTEPIQYPSKTPRYALPLLFSGQAQKEFFVNAALSLCDALLHPAVEGEADTPPTDPQEGEMWLVGPAPVGEFAGHAEELALRQQSDWAFAVPRDGLRVLDRASGQQVVFDGEWRRPDPVLSPEGGATVDAEARAAIGALIAALGTSGILPQN